MPRPQVTCTENLVKFGCVIFGICEQTDRHTHSHNTLHSTGGKVNGASFVAVLSGHCG